MEGHMHERGPVCTRVPLVMFYVGGWWGVVLWCQVAVLLTVSVLSFHVITRVVCVCACVCVFRCIFVDVLMYVYLCKCV